MGGGENLPIGPGFWGFVAAFVLAVSLWLLMRNMSGRMRRMAYRERERAEETDGAPAGAGAEPDQSAPDTATGGSEDDRPLS
ncbi:MAG: hypothetical protein ABIS35_10105 [Terracoccus sp.]